MFCGVKRATTPGPTLGQAPVRFPGRSSRTVDLYLVLPKSGSLVLVSAGTGSLVLVAPTDCGTFHVSAPRHQPDNLEQRRSSCPRRPNPARDMPQGNAR